MHVEHHRQLCDDPRYRRRHGEARGVCAPRYDCNREHGTAAVRIGITGEGLYPNYRVEYREDTKIKVFSAYSGRGHKPVPDLGDWPEG